jgi:CopG family transcriptional regulator/antitoxin EndoAI
VVRSSFDIHTIRVYISGRSLTHTKEPDMSVRINVSLPDETVRVLDRVAPRGNRSRLISDAVMHYVSSRGRSTLAGQLKAGALANVSRDMAIAQEWFPLEEEACQRTASRPKSKK